MKSSAPPAAPDPATTAAAQTQMNKDTAVAQYGLNATNQVTPQGSLTYSQSGTWADGTPRFTATQSYSPQEQALYDKSKVTENNLADIGNNQSAKIGQLLDTPFNVDSATSEKIQGLQNKFLDPQWQRQQQGLETQLINKGVRPGSEAYTRAMGDFSQQRQSAYDQSYLDSYNTGRNAALTERNQPINEISALLSGSQVSQPNYASTPNAGIAPTDYTGLVQNKYQGDLAAYNIKQQNSNALMSGLFGLGKTALGGWGGYGK